MTPQDLAHRFSQNDWETFAAFLPVHIDADQLKYFWNEARRCEAQSTPATRQYLKGLFLELATLACEHVENLNQCRHVPARPI